MMIHPRWFAKLWANINGYFWLPCPICGEPFAGFEHSSIPLLKDAFGAGEVTCSKPKCISETRSRNEELCKDGYSLKHWS